MAKLDEVFGVSAKPVHSYIERSEVDTRFVEALASDKQIIVYGSSKQGKTALVSKHLSYSQNCVVSLTPRTNVVDIYHRILINAGVVIYSRQVDKGSTEGSLAVGAKVNARLPLFGGGEASLQGGLKAGSGADVQYEAIPINLELPQSIVELLRQAGSSKWIILENFHYLNDETQRQLAFDLRAFQELGLRFVILGVWREKNRMAQFNGDLLDRVIEIPVEPWIPQDFQRVVKAGSEILNMRFSSALIEAAIEASFSSIGVFQELLKGVCVQAGITETLASLRMVDDVAMLVRTSTQKANEYAARHQRAMEAIAAGHPSGGAKNDLLPLFLPYYLVKVILESGYEGVADGMRRSDIQDRIRAIHHRAKDIRASDMSNLLHGLASLQAAKNISPPIVDYDLQNRMLQVVDSTFYFFIKNANLGEIISALPSPLDERQLSFHDLNQPASESNPKNELLETTTESG